MIPENWKIVKMEEILELKTGERPNMEDLGIYPVFGANGIMGKTSKSLVENDFIIVIGRVGASGKVHLAQGKTWISDNAIYSKSYNKENIYMFFLYYLLRFKNLEHFAIKTTHPIITQSFLNKYRLFLPPLPEQKRIAEILSTVDQAIDKTNTAIEKTERLKNGLMQQLLTKGIGHKEFQKTKIGLIPKAWSIKKIGEVITLCQYGLSKKITDIGNIQS